MKFPTTFSSKSDKDLESEFLSRGYSMPDTENMDVLLGLRERVVALACEKLGVSPPKDHEKFLREIHNELPIKRLNQFRLNIYNHMNAQDWFRPTYFSLARKTIENLVGNELAMQNQVNFSIQMPDDASSLIPIHSDAFSGETPFQVVLWIPLVSTQGRNSMFLLSPEHNRKFFPELKSLSEAGGMKAVFDVVEPYLEWLTVPFGKVLIFSPNLLHGNVVNDTSETRWSMNSRFTGLFTPYTSPGKNLGAFYLPISTRPVSRVGMKYRPPIGFE